MRILFPRRFQTSHLHGASNINEGLRLDPAKGRVAALIDLAELDGDPSAVRRVGKAYARLSENHSEKARTAADFSAAVIGCKDALTGHGCPGYCYYSSLRHVWFPSLSCYHRR